MALQSFDDSVIERLVRWGEEQPRVRAMLLTSTRAVPGAKLDSLSDYDVILVLEDIEPFVADRAWLGQFGEVVVAYWDPVHLYEGTDHFVCGNVVQYAGDLKIDFSLWPVPLLTHFAQQRPLLDELDAGYRVLLDKDSLTQVLPAPTGTAYVPKRPDEATFQLLVNDFFVGAPYVAKCLLRDELLPGKWCLDYDMRFVYLVPMLEWWVGCETGWSVPVGSNGKGLKARLPGDIWSAFEATFAGASISENWDSLYRMLAFFRQIGTDVAHSLGYAYPLEFDQQVVAHVRSMQARGVDAA